MEKIRFTSDELQEETEFFVLEQTEIKWSVLHSCDGFRRRRCRVFNFKRIHQRKKKKREQFMRL